jgi:hypothetical protein
LSEKSHPYLPLFKKYFLISCIRFSM